MNIGNVRRALGDYTVAAEAYERVIAIDPAYPSATARLADVRRAFELRR
jgi:hypothetical protein